MYPKVILYDPILFGEKARRNFGKFVILSVAPTVPCYAEQSFSVLWKPKTNLRSTMGQDYLRNLALLCVERVYVHRVNFQPIFRPKNASNIFLDLVKNVK